jgi:tetratricopeptide (TPR) repeat protein
VEAPSAQALVLRTLAPVYTEAGRFDDAIRAYGRYIELTGRADARLGLARTLLRADRPEEVLAVLDVAGRGSVTAALLRARALAHLDQHAQARRVVDDRFRQSEPARLRARMRLVLDSAPLDDGEAELRSLFAAGPDDPFLRSALGFYLAVWGKDSRDEALGLLRGVAAAAPEEAELQANLGWGLHRLGLSDEAIAPLETALALDSSRHQDRTRLASVLHHLGRDRERALDLVRVALARRPAAPWAEEARSLQRALELELVELPAQEDDS